MREKKYFVSCSFGKDSIATILLGIEHNEPIDGVVYAEVMFDLDRNISGEIPEHIEWIKNIAIPKIESFGIPVYVVRNEKNDYVKEFKHIVKKSKNPDYNGKMRGFVIAGKCKMNSDGKIKPMQKFYKQFGKNNVIQYVGIAIDEPKRLERMHKKDDRISLLEKYNYTEADAKELCKKYGLLSPLYDNGTRGGCWFCPNCKIKEFAHIKKNHNHLWKELEELDKLPHIGSFKYGKPLTDIGKKVDEYIKKNKNIYDC